MIYDAAIIGTGPAGLSAALNLQIHNKNFIWIGNPKLSDKVSKAEKIKNYPGFCCVTGEELNRAFLDQVKNYELTIEEQMVNSVQKFDGHYAVMAGSELFETHTLVFATGVTAVGLLPGEADLLGKGVSYCATCDGWLYREKTIGVICNAQRFEHEVEYLAEMADKVYYFPLYSDVKVKAENVEIMTERATKMLNENGRFSGLQLKNGEVLPMNGVFCLRDSVSLDAMLPELVREQGHIVVDRHMETNLKGCYAAGDCTGRPYQYTKAVGEGNVAAHSVIEYLATLEKQN